jgi:hypothetical protein
MGDWLLFWGSAHAQFACHNWARPNRADVNHATVPGERQRKNRFGLVSVVC